MPVFQLSEEMVFPHPSLANEDGVLAVGGDLSPERLLLAYTYGIFPWFDEDSPILWWSPDPRTVLYPHKVKPSKSMRKVLRDGRFQVTFDRDFRTVMERCGTIARKDQEGTWINPDMLAAYTTLHQHGLAHSVEVWLEEKLVGGLYGVHLGQCFFGESMFAEVSNASKAGFYHLIQQLLRENVRLVDCQMRTDHLISLGAEDIPRDQFMEELDQAVNQETNRQLWSDVIIPPDSWR